MGSETLEQLESQFLLADDDDARLSVVVSFFQQCERECVQLSAESWLMRGDPTHQYLAAWLMGRGDGHANDQRNLAKLSSFLLEGKCEAWVAARALRSIGNLPLVAAERILLELFPVFFPEHSLALSEALATPKAPPTPVCWDCLRRLATDEVSTIREWAVFGLAERLHTYPACSPPGFVDDILEAALTDDSSGVRAEAIRGMIATDKKRGVCALLHELRGVLDATLLDAVECVLSPSDQQRISD